MYESNFFQKFEKNRLSNWFIEFVVSGKKWCEFNRSLSIDWYKEDMILFVLPLSFLKKPDITQREDNISIDEIVYNYPIYHKIKIFIDLLIPNKDWGLTSSKFLQRQKVTNIYVGCVLI